MLSHEAVVNVVTHQLFISFRPSCPFASACTLNVLGLHLPNKAPVLSPCLRLCILERWISVVYFISDSLQYFEAGKNVIVSHTLKRRELKLREVK